MVLFLRGFLSDQFGDVRSTLRDSLSVLIAGQGLKFGSTVDVWQSLCVLDGGGSYAIALADLLYGELASANAAPPAG